MSIHLSQAQRAALKSLVNQNNGYSLAFVPMRRGITHEEYARLRDAGYLREEWPNLGMLHPAVAITELGRRALDDQPAQQGMA